MNEDKIIKKLIELEERVDACATNERVDRLEERIMNVLDGHTVILQRLDQERVFTNERIGRIETDIGFLKKSICPA